MSTSGSAIAATINNPQSLSVFIPLVKIDEERRLIIARAAQEVLDKSTEIMDYETAKPQFQSWSREFEEMSGGLSKGNVRVMHTRTVAGKVTDIGFDDDAKAVDVVMKISDDNEWRKALDGCYTGVSIGGGYLKKWKDPTGATRYTPKISEMSLVDSPCIPTARFAELVKADGLVEQIELRGAVRTFAERWAARPLTFAEMTKGAAAAEAARPKTFGEMQKGIWGTLGSMALGGLMDAVAPEAGAAEEGASLASGLWGGAKAAAGAAVSGIASGARAFASHPGVKTGLLAASAAATGADMAAAGINLAHAATPPKPVVVRVPTPPTPAMPAAPAAPKAPAAPALPKPSNALARLRGMRTPRVPGMPRMPA